ncbi:MAG: type IV pilus biogenesis/stability protein PilW [Gammaproteobacteria bacterium]|nr:type IV pilus biogenesis/stability protein PilW [Gammaproteobacteria bacterium]NNF61652.1 type IV pilus biogenesis/stability protein PilW [Gammaproteobacteria bacterium]NNM20542.1 type IV pilus biogenesis/stability protein PilW [Gammaproteobacteria bacterium]
MRIVICALLVVFAGACVTTGDVDPVEADPREAALTNLRLGSEYLQRGERERALNKLTRAVQQDPHLAPAHAYLALAYEQLGRADEAGRHYRTALRLDDNDATVRNMYAVHLCRNGRIDEAEKNFLAAATVPTYITPETALTNAGVCVMKLPDQEKAEAYFRQALNLNPRYADALWQMAKLSTTANRDFQARAFLQRLDEVATMSSQALWLGVQIERRLGDSRAAALYAEQLRLKYPESVETRLLVESMRDAG